MKRRIFSQFVLIPLMLMVSALPVFGTGNKQQKTEGSVTVSCWVDGSIENFATTAKITDTWNKEHPEFQVEVIPLPEQESYQQKILTAAAGGALPDILRMDEVFVPQFATEGILADITGYVNGNNPMNKADFTDNALNMVQYNGKFYGYPEDHTQTMLAYRKDSFIAAGLDPNKPPKTWAELLEYAKKLTDPSRNQYGFVIQPYDYWFSGWVWMNGGSFFSPDGKKCTMTSPEAIEALQYYVDLYQKHHVVPPAAVSAMYTQGAQFSAESAFINGQIAMFQIGPWFSRTYYISRPEDVENLMYAPLPVPGNGKNIPKSVMGGRLMSISNTSQYKDKAWEYVKYLCENKVQHYKDFVNANLNDMPKIMRELAAGDLLPRKSAHSLPYFQHKHMKTFTDTIDNGRLQPRLTQFVLVGRTVNEELQAAIIGQKTPREAMEAMARRIQPELDKTK
jgi:ABC-type glycerol-3-phosphate transport system substrate-binding protein